MSSNHKSEITTWLFSVGIAIGVYLSVAFFVWQARNPLANQMTFYTHFVDMVKFHKLDKFN